MTEDEKYRAIMKVVYKIEDMRLDAIGDGDSEFAEALGIRRKRIFATMHVLGLI